MPSQKPRLNLTLDDDVKSAFSFVCPYETTPGKYR